MVNKNISLPKGCRIRPADLDDQSGLKQLLWEFTLSEAVGIYFQQFIYIPILLFASLISICIAWILNVDIRIISSLAGLIIIVIIYILWWIFIKPGLNWERYWVIECNFRLVACGTVEKYPTYSRLNYLYVKPELGDYSETSAKSGDYWEQSAKRDYAELTAKSDNGESNTKRTSKLTEYLIRYLIQQTNPPIYLLCQPNMVEFYANIGFVRPSLSELPPQFAKRYRSFKNSALGVIMQFKTNLDDS
ncbi:hypothetical protein [Limnofasciculus baicalensis]|uniref:Uncharacterized protein n=1 Tax=Limnofasciculus baicalensis BBK-W-15 TaxID=2699891 RepID=A0AAE3GYA2_9CYAN|nr:hypothetical protein [Limnofasciculus baicalensis]MCP2730837.1 hypothetical protein [Limnofasciculus baicalensis BBK-W-15]